MAERRCDTDDVIIAVYGTVVLPTSNPHIVVFRILQLDSVEFGCLRKPEPGDRLTASHEY